MAPPLTDDERRCWRESHRFHGPPTHQHQPRFPALITASGAKEAAPPESDSGVQLSSPHAERAASSPAPQGTPLQSSHQDPPGSLSLKNLSSIQTPAPRGGIDSTLAHIPATGAHPGHWHTPAPAVGPPAWFWFATSLSRVQVRIERARMGNHAGTIYGPQDPFPSPTAVRFPLT
jgi:hypothetical protein